MSSTINILFLGGSRRVSVGEIFIETGRNIGHTVNIFSYELDSNEPIASIGTIIKGLKWNDSDLKKDLIEVINKYNINIVVPFVDIATIICSELKELLRDVHFCVSDKFISTTLFSKKKSHEWFEEKNFLVPSVKLEVPLVAKLVTGSGAKGMFYLKTSSELDWFNSNYDVNNYFIQQFIEGSEFSIDCYVDKYSNIISVVPRIRLEVINGEATKSVTIRDEELIKETIRILTTCKFTGPVTVQFIRDKISDKLYLLEINPRLGSGVLTSIKAGANICAFILNDYLNKTNTAVLDWKENLLMIRAFKEYYFDATNN